MLVLIELIENLLNVHLLEQHDLPEKNIECKRLK